VTGARGTTVEQAASSPAAAIATQRVIDARAPMRCCATLAGSAMTVIVNPLEPGLYIVATPIGNLGDLSPRAADILTRADVVAVEDSRVTAGLLRHIGVKRPMVPYHDHNAEGVRPNLIARMASESIALVSDAGTPLISDPGYKLVRDARAAGHLVVTIPGPCAAVAALTLAGLPTDRFMFLGFLPSKEKARAEAIAEIAAIRATLVLYESGPRLAACLAALADGLGERDAAVTREISKRFEEAVTGTLAALATRYAEAETPPRGEIVVVVGPPGAAPPASAADADTALAEALTRLTVSQAAGEVAKQLGLDRKALYARALAMKAGGGA
jgi:16S rRNA (cytidine1402-2'-O)-methyltransferase